MVCKCIMGWTTYRSQSIFRKKNSWVKKAYNFSFKLCLLFLLPFTMGIFRRSGKIPAFKWLDYKYKFGGRLISIGKFSKVCYFITTLWVLWNLCGDRNVSLFPLKVCVTQLCHKTCIVYYIHYWHLT